MRKLTILKSLIDFIWIVTCIPAVLILIFLAVYMFFEPESINFVFDMKVSTLEATTLKVQLLLLAAIVLSFISIYCLYLFRKTLRYFQKVTPFHDEVISNFHKIGYLLLGVGISATVVYFLAQLIIENKLKIQLGLSPYLMIICLGLFFMVLSEVFKVAKIAKEENELTV